MFETSVTHTFISPAKTQNVVFQWTYFELWNSLFYGCYENEALKAANRSRKSERGIQFVGDCEHGECVSIDGIANAKESEKVFTFVCCVNFQHNYWIFGEPLSSFRKHSFSQYFDEHLNWLNIDKCLTYPTRLRQMASHTLTNAIGYTIQMEDKWHMNAHALLLEKKTKCFSHLINLSQPFDLELELSTVYVRAIMIVSPFNDYNIHRNIQILTK